MFPSPRIAPQFPQNLHANVQNTPKTRRARRGSPAWPAARADRYPSISSELIAVHDESQVRLRYSHRETPRERRLTVP
jgi:hypothetical protein